MEFNRINLLLPTRNRVISGKLPKYLQSVVDTVSDLKNIVFTFLVDEDDLETKHFLASNQNIKCDYQVIVNTELKSPHLGKFYNIMYRETKFSDPGTLVSMTGDDMVFRTKDWDARILSEVDKNNGAGIFHCRDGIQNGRICVNLFTTRKWINATGGEFMSEIFPADFIDEIHTKVSKTLGRCFYFEDIFIEHEHSGLSPVETYDDTFLRLRSQYQVSMQNLDKLYDIVNVCINNVRKSGII